MNRMPRHTPRYFSPSAALLGLCLLSACSAPVAQSEVDEGSRLFVGKALSQSRLNDYNCAVCHDAVASNPPSKKAGGALAGVTLRTSFWGGQVADLLGSVNACRENFMADNRPLSPKDEPARALYAYLASLEPGNSEPIPFTIVTTIDPLPRGDTPEAIADAERRGQDLYAQTCMTCHGTMHDGLGRLSTRVPILPEETLAEHPPPQYTPRVQRLVFTEKIRHGLFLGYGGVMPPFSSEVLSDAEVSDLLEALGVIGQ